MKIKPQLIAHRGYAAAYPENTLPAFQAAIDLGVKWLECDLQMTADGAPVIVHDTNLIRVAGKPVEVLTSPEAVVLSSAIEEDVYAPTLMQLLALLKRHPDVRLFLEFKTESLEAFGLEAVFDQVWAQVGELQERVIPTSYSEQLCHYARAQGAFAIGWVAAKWDEKHHAIADALQPDYLFSNLTRLPDEEPFWEGPWQWVVYEVTDPMVAERLVGRGIHFIESMDPEALIHHAPFVNGADV